MADELDALFNSGDAGLPQAGQGGMPSTQGSQPEAPGPDPLDQIFQQPQAPQAPAVDELDALFAAPAAQAPQQVQISEPEQPPADPTRPGLGEAFSAAVTRGVGQFESALPAMAGMIAEATGDEVEKQRSIERIQEIEARMPKPVIGSIADIHSQDDFFMWAVEKFGEQAPVLASMMLTGGVGALAGNLTARGMLLTGAAKSAMIRKGATTGVFGGSVGIETPGTAIEQVQSTGNFNPGLSLGTGIVKGALESYTPFKFLKELPTTGIIAGGLKAAGREAITEGLQEQADILARDYSDPNYNYFSKEMVLRTLDAAAAGGLVGGGVGTAGHALGKAVGLKTGDPGEDTPVTPNDLVNYPPAPEDDAIERVKQGGPLSWLRDRYMRGDAGSPEVMPLNPTASEDVVEQGTLTGGIKRDWKRAGAKAQKLLAVQNFVDDNTSRYVIVNNDGSNGSRIYTALGLEEELARRPNQEFMPYIAEVDMDTLQPAAITAELFDLPDSSSNRLYFTGKRMFFLPGIGRAQEESLKLRYDALVQKIESKPWMTDTLDETSLKQIEEMQAEYNDLTTKGLRVIPSPGASFHYNGYADGKQINRIPKSTRSVQVAYQDGNGVLSTFKEPPYYNPDMLNLGLEPVAVDFARMPEGSIVSPEGVPLAREDWGRLPFKIKPGVKIPRGALVRGIDNPQMVHRNTAFGTPTEARTKGELQVWGRPSGAIGEATLEIARYIKELQPVLKNLYTRLGIKNPPTIVIDADAYRSSYIDMPSNQIVYVMKTEMENGWYMGETAEARRMNVLFTIMHELGHGVTLRAWGKLPSALHEQAFIEYERAILKYRTTGATEHIGYPVGTFTATGLQIDYNLTFVEYLAETFRRWAISDARVMTDLEKFYKSTGTELQRLYREAAKLIGEDKAKNLYSANFAFHNVMEYLETASDTNPVNMMARGLQLDSSYPTPIQLADTFIAIEAAVAEFRHLLTQDTNVILDRGVDFAPGRDWVRFGGMDTTARNLRIMIGSLALMGDKVEGRTTVVHEAFHGIQDMLTDVEAEILVREGRRRGILTPSQLRNIHRDWTSQLDKWGVELTPEERTRVIRWAVDNEYMAEMATQRLNGNSFIEAVNIILDRIIGTVQKVISYLKGGPFLSADDVIRAFYRGEMTRRYDEAQRNEARNIGLDQAMGRQVPSQPALDPQIVNLDADNVLSIQESKDPSGKVKLATYVMLKPDGTVKGWAELSHDPIRGYAVDNVYVERAFYREQIPMKIYKIAEDRLGETPKPNGLLTPAGYRALVKINPALVANYVFNERMNFWYSPNYLQEHIAKLASIVARDKRLGRPVENTRAVLAEMRGLQKKTVPDSPTAFVGREMRLKNVEMETRRSDAELVKSVTGETIDDTTDQFAEIMDQVQDAERQVAAKALGISPDMAAPSQADQYASNQILANSVGRWLSGGRAFSGEQNPDVDPFLSGTPSDGRTVNGIRYEKDRISWFSKIFFGLHQLAWRNMHLFQLRTYLALCEQMNTKIMQWISRADDVAKAWDKLPEDQRNGLTEYMFWLTEMEYLTPPERAANVVRHPTAQERQQYITQHRLGPDTVAAGLRVEQEFADYLSEVERVTIRNAQRTFATNPTGLAAELAAIAADMANLRAKPYFPMTRFGEYTITVRDPSNNSVQAFFAYATTRERDAAVRQVYRSYPGNEISVGRVPEEAQEFMGLPGPLLRLIKANMAPQLSPAQRDWLDNFTAMMSPERSFRKRWLARQGTPGYSLDGIRVFSQYFRSGARYLGRIEFRDDMQDQVRDLQATIRAGMRDSTRRSMIVDYMQKHLNYIMEGGRDWGKMKSIISIFQLGGSVAAAAMNMTQVPLATYPYLAGLFGDAATLRALKRNADVLRPTFGQPARGTTDYLAARDEAVAQGKIEAGQAIDLGAFAEYDNLNRSYAGTAVQRTWRQIGYWSMILFSRSEQFNREWTFKAAYELALENQNSRHFREMSTLYANEILDIAARRGITPDQATAFMVARRTIDQTQLIFQTWARPTFLRGGFASTLQIFFSYTQGMLYLLGNSPGAKRMWFGLLIMYGLAGLPGADDLDKLIRLLARKFLGKDFSPELEARKMVRQATKGTMFDQVGPDLVMHGISRYSLFGIGMLPEGYGIPRFDASASGGMGSIVPGLGEALRAAGNNAKWKDLTADVARDISGAGFGQMFAMLQFLNSSPMTSDLKKWEKVFPRSVKAASKAYRYATQGQELTNQGGTFAKFDMRDPDDVATVVAQLLGFTPEKITAKWAGLRATQDIALWYETRKTDLYAQLDVAIQRNDGGEMNTVVQRMVDFNKELSKQGWGAMGITNPTKVLSSMRQRARVRALQGADLPVKTNQIPLAKDMKDLYPGMVIERKKVQ
jgi:hypothetical protein